MLAASIFTCRLIVGDARTDNNSYNIQCESLKTSRLNLIAQSIIDNLSYQLVFHSILMITPVSPTSSYRLISSWVWHILYIFSGWWMGGSGRWWWWWWRGCGGTSRSHGNETKQWTVFSISTPFRYATSSHWWGKLKPEKCICPWEINSTLHAKVLEVLNRVNASWTRAHLKNL